ncbi:MAG: hypothetical protein ACO3DK_04535 [Bacteroidia bacterium]
MNDPVTHPIQALLNELASIAKSGHSPQSLEELEQTKSLAARLYLELDLALLELQAPSDEELDAWVEQMEPAAVEPMEHAATESVSQLHQEPEAPHSFEPASVPDVQEAPAPAIQTPAEAIEEGVHASAQQVFEPVKEEQPAASNARTIESEEIASAPSVTPETVEEAPTPEADLSEIQLGKALEEEAETHAVRAESAEMTGDKLSTPPPSANAENASLNFDADAWLMSLSMSRRYEFANFLFGGDMGRFRLFLTEFAMAGSEESRSVYERWFQENDWKRKDESASELYRLLKRSL